jgi:hypothetical protein
MKRKSMKTKICFLMACVVLIVGCGTAELYMSGYEPVYVNEPKERYQLLKHFAEVENFCFDNEVAYDVTPVIKRVLREHDGDAVVHVTWRAKLSAEDVVLTLFSFGLAKCWDLEFTGDVIKWK